MFDAISRPKTVHEHVYWLTTLDYTWKLFETRGWIHMRNMWRELNNRTPVASLVLASQREPRFLLEAGIFAMASKRGV